MQANVIAPPLCTSHYPSPSPFFPCPPLPPLFLPHPLPISPSPHLPIPFPSPPPPSTLLHTPPCRFDSEIFQDDWFGAASPGGDTHAIQRGLWAGVALPDGSAYKVCDQRSNGDGMVMEWGEWREWGIERWKGRGVGGWGKKGRMFVRLLSFLFCMYLLPGINFPRSHSCVSGQMGHRQDRVAQPFRQRVRVDAQPLEQQPFALHRPAQPDVRHHHDDHAGLRGDE